MKYRSLQRTSDPVVEPVSLADAKQHLRVDIETDDLFIQGLITAAREWCEVYTSRAFVHQRYVMRLDSFPAEITLPRPPMARSGAVTAVTVTYTINDGSTANQTTAVLSTDQYRVDREATPGVVRTLYAGVWPSNLLDQNSITVTWWAGYGADGASVPKQVRAAILMLVGHWYENRQSVLTGTVSKTVEFGVHALLDSIRWGDYR